MPLEEFTPGWVSVHVGIEGDCVSLQGLNPWKCNWHHLADEPIVVPQPSHPHERHRAWVTEIENSGKMIQFAAGELSNGVWGFYVSA